MSPKQKKLAGKAPPPNKLDEKDFAVLRSEKAKGRGMGLQDESKKPGKMYKAALGVMAMKKAKDKGAKGPELLSPVMLAKRLFNKKAGGVMKYKRGSGLDLPVISSVKPAVHKTKRAQNLSKMKIQFNKQRSRMGDFAKKKGLPKPLNTSANFKGAGKFPYVSKTTTMAEMRKAKGFKPGESATDFNKRRKMLAGVTKAASATKIGKIVLPIAAAGVAAQQYLKSKMNKKNNKTLRDARLQKKPGIPSETTQKINKAISKIKTVKLKPYEKIGDAPDTTKLKKTLKGAKDFRSAYIRDEQKVKKKMGGGMMQRPMGNTMMQQPMMQKPMGYKSGGMDTGKVGEMKSIFAVALDKYKKTKPGAGPMGRLTSSDIKKLKKLTGVGKAARPIKKNMGGMMMQRPMGYKHGTSVTAKCKLGRNKATKIT